MAAFAPQAAGQKVLVVLLGVLFPCPGGFLGVGEGFEREA